MGKRAKRLKKGIASIERIDYYEKEIFGLEAAKDKKKKQLDKE